MNWRIEAADVRFAARSKDVDVIRSFPEQKVLYRSDTRAPLAIVSKRYGYSLFVGCTQPIVPTWFISRTLASWNALKSARCVGGNTLGSDDAPNSGGQTAKNRRPPRT